MEQKETQSKKAQRSIQLNYEWKLGKSSRTTKPSEIPDRILHVSVSFLGVVILLWPGLLFEVNRSEYENKK